MIMNFCTTGVGHKVRATNYQESRTRHFSEASDEVFKLEASAGQLIAATSTWALGSFNYSAGIMDWSPHGLEQLDLMIRRRLAACKIRGPTWN